MMQRHFMVSHKLVMPTLSSCTCSLKVDSKYKDFAIVVLRCGKPTRMVLGSVAGDDSRGPASTIKE
jgi:hypothetical protein